MRVVFNTAVSKALSLCLQRSCKSDLSLLLSKILSHVATIRWKSLCPAGNWWWHMTAVRLREGELMRRGLIIERHAECSFQNMQAPGCSCFQRHPSLKKETSVDLRLFQAQLKVIISDDSKTPDCIPSFGMCFRFVGKEERLIEKFTSADLWSLSAHASVPVCMQMKVFMIILDVPVCVLLRKWRRVLLRRRADMMCSESLRLCEGGLTSAFSSASQDSSKWEVSLHDSSKAPL